MNRYKNSNIIKNTNENVGKLGSQYLSQTRYPEIPLSENDIYVITEFGDRLDLLANQFYGDTSLYWIIASANPNEVSFGSLFIEEGTQIRIPTEISVILNEFLLLNN